jgi:hypothetical protein
LIKVDVPSTSPVKLATLRPALTPKVTCALAAVNPATIIVATRISFFMIVIFVFV